MSVRTPRFALVAGILGTAVLASVLLPASAETDDPSEQTLRQLGPRAGLDTGTAAAGGRASARGVRGVLWQEDFDGADPGSTYTDGVVVVPDGGYDDSPGVQATYHLVKGENGSGSNRMVRNIPFENDSVEEVTMTYRLKFEDDFDTTIGGKFMGVGPAEFVTGGRNTQPNGWSARIVMNDRVPHIYVYDQDKTFEFGRKVDPFTEDQLEKGRWYELSLYVRLNSAGYANDGLIELFVDGKRRAVYKDVRLRGVTTPDTLPTTMLFHTFLGGTAEGTSIGTAHASFDDITVTAGRPRPHRQGWASGPHSSAG